MNPFTQSLALLVAWWRTKPHNERGGLQVTTEHLLWTFAIIGIVGIVGGLMSGYIMDLVYRVTGGH
ncbi:MAG: hypothetical protein KIT69_19375 [Propionibacteriaceae bacterium]|nr:hypothetical protein [Propionibacteriaceae bacterium]